MKKNWIKYWIKWNKKDINLIILIISLKNKCNQISISNTDFTAQQEHVYDITWYMIYKYYRNSYITF